MAYESNGKYRPCSPDRISRAALLLKLPASKAGQPSLLQARPVLPPVVGWGELGETARTYTQYYRGIAGIQEPMTLTMFGGSGANTKCFQAVSLTPDGYGVTS